MGRDRRVMAEVRVLLQTRQDQRKAELDAHRRDVLFAVGDEVLLDTERTPLPSRSLLSLRWMGPFKVLAYSAPNSSLRFLGRCAPMNSTLSSSGLTTGAPTVSAALRARLRLPWRRRLAGVRGAGAAHVQHGLGPALVLVRWAGCDASLDTWEPLDNLTSCEEAVTAFEQALGRPLPRPAPLPPAVAAPLPTPLAGFTIDAAPPGNLRVVAAWSSWGELVTGRRVAARYSRTPLPARRLLARGRPDS